MKALSLPSLYRSSIVILKRLKREYVISFNWLVYLWDIYNIRFIMLKRLIESPNKVPLSIPVISVIIKPTPPASSLFKLILT